MRKHGLDNFKFEIIKKTYDLDYWEYFFIKLYKAANEEYGFNIISKENEKYFTERVVDRIIKSRNKTIEKRGYIYTPEMKKYLSDIKNGDKNPFYGKHHSEEIIKINREKHSKKVVCVETGQIFDSIAEACKKTNANGVGISFCCQGKRNTCCGYHWKYYGKDTAILNIKKHKSYYKKCIDPITKEECFYYVLHNRIRRHKDLYKNIKIGECVI